MADPLPEQLHVAPVPAWLHGGQLETIVGATGELPLRPLASQRRVIEVEPGSAVESWWSRPRPEPEHARGSVLLVHGLGGSARRPHILALADEALRRGWHVVRVNLRNHGGTTSLASTLFSAVQSDDLGRVLEAMEAAALPRPFALVGVSLGANMALRYAAQAGEASRADAVATLNPALDFFIIERELDRPANLLYRVNFVTGLCTLIAQIRTQRPVPGPPATLLNIHSVREFDHHFTAPAAGFASVDDYYAAAGAGAILDGLRVPAYLLTAMNDPIIPPAMVAAHHGAAHGRVHVALADRGGHVGYRVRGEDGALRFWAARPVFDHLESRLYA